MSSLILSFFFFNDTATTEIYTLSLHDALPICTEKEISSEELGKIVMEHLQKLDPVAYVRFASVYRKFKDVGQFVEERSEEHTSELQSLAYLVCRLLLEKKKKYEETDSLVRYTI